MKSRGLRHAIGIGAFLIGLVLALPGPAAATGFSHSQRHAPSSHGFQQHQFRHFGYHQPYFFRDHRGFLHRYNPNFWQYHHGFHQNKFHHGGFHPYGFYGGSRTIFIWR